MEWLLSCHGCQHQEPGKNRSEEAAKQVDKDGHSVRPHGRSCHRWAVFFMERVGRQ